VARIAAKLHCPLPWLREYQRSQVRVGRHIQRLEHGTIVGRFAMILVCEPA
jgi:hypothetical protein